MPAGELRLWYRSIFFTFFLFSVLIVYSYLYYQEMSLLMLSKAFASTGGFLIGISFALSGICYFFNFLDTKIAYRKYLGLIGYFCAFVYSCLLLVDLPEIYFYGFIRNFFTADILLGLGAMAILTMMAFISNNGTMMKIGPQRWRSLLRLGYLAYALLIVRAFYVDGQQWLEWLAFLDRVPPPRMVLTVFAICVILLRIAVSVHKFVKSKKKVAESALNEGVSVVSPKAP